MNLKSLENAEKRNRISIEELKNEISVLNEEMESSSIIFKKAQLKSKISGIISFILLCATGGLCINPSLILFAIPTFVACGGLFAYSQNVHNKGLDVVNHYKFLLQEEHKIKMDLSNLEFKDKCIKDLMEQLQKEGTTQSVFVKLDDKEIVDLSQEEVEKFNSFTQKTNKTETVENNNDDENMLEL